MGGGIVVEEVRRLHSNTELPRHSNLTANKAINNLNMVPPLQVNTLLSNKVNMVPLLQALLQDSMGAPLHNSHTANKGNILHLPLHPQAMVQCNTSHMTESQTPKLSKRL